MAEPRAAKRVLLIAFHYPPIVGSSGVHRALRFSQYLREFGWEPAVLTAHPRAYGRVGMDLMGDIPPGLPVARAFAVDTSRHLRIGGSYPLWLALPDQWSSWCVGAVPAGMRLIRRFRPQLLWSTYPIATAHAIGLVLHRLTKLPWIADFRDSMTEDGYPTPPTKWRVYRWIEGATVRRAARSVFTAPGTLRMYAGRYPEVSRDHWGLIPNGYDEESFASLNPAPAGGRGGKRLVLVHSGILYPSERDPRPFFRALATMRQAGLIGPESLQVVLRASGHDAYHRRLIEEHRLQDLVILGPPLGYREALAEMLGADGLLLFQASNCNHQIPAKLYEYLRAGRPILALTDPVGDTAEALRQLGIDTIAPLDVEERVRGGLVEFLARIRAGTAPIPDPRAVAQHSRRARTAELAALFDGVLGGDAPRDSGARG